MLKCRFQTIDLGMRRYIKRETPQKPKLRSKYIPVLMPATPQNYFIYISPNSTIWTIHQKSRNLRYPYSGSFLVLSTHSGETSKLSQINSIDIPFFERLRSPTPCPILCLYPSSEVHNSFSDPLSAETVRLWCPQIPPFYSPKFQKGNKWAPFKVPIVHQ